MTDSLVVLLQQHPDRDTVRIETLMELAHALERENPGASVSFALDAQDIAVELALPIREADAIQQVGNSYGVLGAYLKQRDCYLAARKIYQDIGDKQGEIAALNNLGTIASQQKNYEFASQYLQKALQMTLASGDLHNLSAIYNNLGSIYLDQGVHDSALTYFSKAHIFATYKNPDPVIASIALVNIGDTYAEKGDPRRSLEIFNACIRDKYKLNDLYGLSELYQNIGDSYRDLAMLDSALHFFKLGLQYADLTQAMEMQEALHRELATVYDTLGQVDMALLHSQQSILLLDSLRQAEATSISQATQLRIAAEETIHARDLAAAKVEIAQQDKLQQQQVVMVAGIVCLGLVLLLVFFLYRRFRERQKAASLLEMKVKLRTHELSEANERLQASMVQTEDSNRDLNTFIYRSSHDLRSPVTSIMGLLDIIKGTFPEAETLKYLSLVEDRTYHLNRLLEQLIESVDLLARAPRGEAVSIRDLWDDVQGILSKKVGHDAVRFTLDAEPGMTVQTDRACLRVILINLLTNAIDFRDNGSGRAPFCIVQVRASAQACTITVQDNGLGMSAAVQARAFEMFYRGGLQAKGTGNGMGLYTAKKTIELLGGDIQLHSEEGRGSTFTLKVPRLVS